MQKYLCKINIYYESNKQNEEKCCLLIALPKINHLIYRCLARNVVCLHCNIVVHHNMKISFDAKRAAQNRTGLGNYSRFVLDILYRYMPDGHFALYTPNPNKVTLLQRLEGAASLSQENDGRFSLHFPSGIWSLCRSLWRTFGITSDLNNTDTEIYHGLSNELPLNIGKAKCKSVVTVHDVIFRSFPQGYKPIDRWIYDYKFRKACENADKVIAVSEFTKQEILRYYHIPAEKVVVVYQGCDEQFRIKATDEQKTAVRKKYALPDNYLLYVGSIEERKNLLLLVKALVKLPADMHIVAVGRKTAYFDKVKAFAEEHGLSERVHFVHGADFIDLPAIYQMADTFIYPSRIEGFGIPLLEALCSGVPAIGCTGSCLEEAGGPDSIYVGPDDEVALAEAVMSIRKSPQLREKMIEKGYAYASNFEEQKLASNLIAVYNSLLSK